MFLDKFFNFTQESKVLVFKIENNKILLFVINVNSYCRVRKFTIESLKVWFLIKQPMRIITNDNNNLLF